jgi:hypothetical protein
MPSRPLIALFFLLNLFLCSWHLDVGHNDNTMSRAAMVAAIVEHHTLHIDAYQELTGDKAQLNGHYYSDKAPLPALIVAPIWWLFHQLGIVRAGDHGLLTDGLLRLGGFVCGSIPLALIITLIWLSLCRVNVEPLWRAPLAMLPLYGSFLFVYSGSFYAHLPGACFLLLAARAMQYQRWIAAGAWCGAAVLCEYTLAVIPVVLVASLLVGRNWRGTLGMVAGGLPFVLVLLLYNLATTGHPTELLYAHEANYTFMSKGFGFALPSLEALFGLTFSAYRGLFYYMPVLLVLFLWKVGSIRSFRDLHRSAPVIVAVVNIVVVSAYAMWWGGWAYGPRHLCAAAVLLIATGLPAIALLERWRPALFVASVIGLFMSWSAKSTVWYSLPTEEHNPIFTIVIPHLRDGDWSHWQWPVSAGLSPMLASFAFLILLFGVIFAWARIELRASRTTE